MLVIGGELNPHFETDSNSTKWLSGVCARTADQAVFVVSALYRRVLPGAVGGESG